MLTTVPSVVYLAVNLYAVDDVPGGLYIKLEEKINNGPWVLMSKVEIGPSATVNRTLPAGATAVYRSQAIDVAGNESPWKTGPAVRLRWIQAETTTNSPFAYSAGWQTETNSNASLHKQRAASTTGNSVAFYINAPVWSVVATKGPNLGFMMIEVDGAVGAIDLYSATATAPMIVFSGGDVGRGYHLVVLSVLGSGGTGPPSRYRIDFDALLVGARVSSPGG